MNKRCPLCRSTYDDATCWTLCPHNPLDVDPAAPYCRTHDLFNCYLCPKEYSVRVVSVDAALLPPEVQPVAEVGSIRQVLMSAAEAEKEAALVNRTLNPAVVVEVVKLSSEQIRSFSDSLFKL